MVLYSIPPGARPRLGTVLVVMMAVIGLSLPETIILRKVLRPRLIAAFVGVVAVGILIVGYEKEAAMVDPKAFLEAGQRFHGHKCPAMPLGLRAGAAAMNALGVERAPDGQLVALVELGDDHCAHCFADGIQMITGCTYGKGNIKQLNYGKWGVTLIDRASGRAVRVVPKAEAMLANKRSEFFTKYRERGIPASQVPPEVVEPMIAKVMSAPDEMLLNVGEPFHHPLPKKVESFAGFVCELCGEMTVEGYGRPLGDKKVCIPCYEKIARER